MSPRVTLLFLLAGCVPDEGTVGACVDDATFFREEVQAKVLEPVCMGCHLAGGLAADSDLVLVGPAWPDQLEVNRAALTHAAGLERGGTSLVLLKPLGEEDHGGGVVLSRDSEGYGILQAFVDRVDHPVSCGDQDDTVDEAAGLVLLSPEDTVRKAAFSLAGRLATEDELRRAREGGEEALHEVVRELMQEEAFVARVRDLFGDVLLTDKYLRGTDGIGLPDYDRYPSLYWYEAESDSTLRGELRTCAAQAIAREPLEIIARIVREDRPFEEILTASWTVVNDCSARSYGITDTPWPDLHDPASTGFREATLSGLPHAGVLTTPAFLERYPTTPTNRNRHRTWAFVRTFLATDILTLADRPIDPTVSEVHNPTLNDPQCTVCHSVMDPIAGTFQNWDEDGDLNPPEEGWYPEMATPGFGSTAMPPSERSRALAWMAEQATADSRFGIAIVRHLFHGLTSVPLLDVAEAEGDPVLEEAAWRQAEWIRALAAQVTADGSSLQDVVEAIVTGHPFRAIGDAGADEATLVGAGTARLLPPEALAQRIRATTGLSWGRRGNETDYLLDRYELLYGGIDHDAVTERLTEPNGVMANVALRMATEVSCEAVPRDLLLPRHQRRLFPWVEARFVPETEDGFAIPESEHLIRENLRWLHERLLGESLALDDPELEASWQLWLETWREGRAAVLDESVDHRLPSECRATSDWWTGESLPSTLRLEDDSDYTVRAWMAVTTYLLSDARFLYE